MKYEEYLPIIKNTKAWAAYCNFINERQTTIINEEEYTEKHHIIPKCYLSESLWDDSENLIELRARDHYVAHELLWKALQDNKMTFAFMRMTHSKQNGFIHWISAIEYEELRKYFCKYIGEQLKGELNFNWEKEWTEAELESLSKAVKKTIYSMSKEERSIKYGHWKGVPCSNERKEYMRALYKGRKNSPESIEKMRLAKKGKLFTEEHKRHLSEAHKGKPSNRKGAHLTEEQKKHLSLINRGKKQSAETIEKRMKAMRGLIWINNGVSNKRVHEYEITEWIKEGWSYGRFKKS